jgi:hypothetical protein
MLPVEGISPKGVNPNTISFIKCINDRGIIEEDREGANGDEDSKKGVVCTMDYDKFSSLPE